MKICIIGCGNIGSIVAKRLAKGNTLYLVDRNKDRLKTIVEETHAKIPKNIQEGVEKSDIIILAVKPNGLDKVIKDLSDVEFRNKIVISVLTGVSLERLKDSFEGSIALRIMPNIALSTGQAVIGIAEDPSLSSKTHKIIETLMRPLGNLHWLPEEKFAALTSLTGSGPAFFYVMLESMVEAGIAMGLKPKESMDLAQQMILGSISVLKETGDHPAKIKWTITTPKGTTIAGLRAMEESGVRAGIMDTFLAAYERAQEQANES